MIQDKENIAACLEAFGEQAAMLVELTLKDAERFVTEINETIKQENTEDLLLAAHSLKSIMRQLGADQVADVASTIEKAAKTDDLATCQGSCDALNSSYTETKSYLETLF